MRNLILIFCLSFPLFTAQAQNSTEKKYPSLLWEITGNGLTKPSYLYGTMHVSEKLAFHLSDTFFVAIQNCDMVALELNPGLWMEQTFDMDEGELMLEFLLSSERTSGFYKAATRFRFPENRELSYFLRSKPRLINSMLYRSNEAEDEFEEDTYLDLFIYQAGSKLNKKVIGLEDFLISRKLVSKAYNKEEDEDDEKYKEERERARIKLRQLEKDKSVREIQEDSYRLGDLDMIDSLYRLLNPGTIYLRYMLWERNIIMADRMDSIMKKNTLFTGVGAAHLPGDKGVIELLRAKGYKVRPVTFTNVNGDKTKTQIENLKVPVKFSKQYPSDSSFSVDLPGRLFQMADRPGRMEYLHNDMANGSFYHIQRLNYFGGLTGKDQLYTLKRIDSLLYENIPGKIQTKKEIKSDVGFPGYDIVNKTRRGDIQRYMIFVGPTEIFLFKMGGRNEYVNGKEAEQFFSSIHFNSKRKGELTTYSPKNGAFKIQIPDTYQVYENRDSKSGIQKQVLTATGKDPKDYFFFIHSYINDFQYLEEDTFELNYMAEVFADEIKGKLLSRQLELKNGRYELTGVVEKEKQKMDVKVSIYGNHYFFFGIISEKEELKNKYFSSLVYLPNNYNRPFETYVDSTLFFSVKTTRNPSAYGSLAIEEMNTHDEGTSKTTKEEKIYVPTRKTKVYMCYETGEKVFVEFRKFSMYYQMKDPKEFWDVQVEALSDDYGMIVRYPKDEKLNTDHEKQFMLLDTNSSRGIKIRMIQKCGVMYTLKSPVDSLEALSPFVNTFFSTFTPADTCIGVDVYSDKLSGHFFNKIYSADTLEKKRAVKAISYVVANLQEIHSEPLMEMISSPDFKTLSLDDQVRMIKGLGNLKDKAIIPFLEKTFYSYTDSLSQQIAILNAIARQKSVKSAEVFLSILKTDLPISSRKEDISGLFFYFQDSLEVGVKLFPKVLALTKYPEYRTPVYELMAELVAKGYLKKKQYSSYKDEILRDAQYELKVYMSTTEGNRGTYYSDYSTSRTPKKGSDPAQALNSDQKKIYNYAILLLPFSSDAKVKQFIDKVLRTRKDDLKILVSAQMLKNNMQVPDTLWSYYSKRPESRALVYRALAFAGQENKLDTALCNQYNMSVSLIYGNQKDFDKDTVVLVQKVFVKTPMSEGYLYIFKSRPKDKSFWKLSYAGYQPKDPKLVNAYPQVSKKGISFDEDEQMKKEIETILKKLRTEGRERAASGYYDEYDYDYDYD